MQNSNGSNGQEAEREIQPTTHQSGMGHHGNRLGNQCRFCSPQKRAFRKGTSGSQRPVLGAVLAMDMDNVRYITGTHIGGMGRDKMNRYAICPRQGKPYLFDPAPPAKRISSPWIENRMEAPISNMMGAIPPELNAQKKFAKQIKRVLADYGVEKEPLGVDHMEITMSGRSRAKACGRRWPAGDAGRPRDQNSRRNRIAEKGRRHGGCDLCRAGEGNQARCS